MTVSFHSIALPLKRLKAGLLSIWMLLAVAIMINVLVDFLFTRLRSSAFYGSESLLFAAGFWLWFTVLLPIVAKHASRSSYKRIVVPIMAVGCHMAFYAIGVTVLSALCYEVTYPLVQTFSFGISNYGMLALIIYGLMALPRTEHETMTMETHKPRFMESLVVFDNNQQRRLVSVNDVLYFQADMPYISLILTDRKYLYNQSLKALESLLDPQLYIRVHKSHILNTKYILTYRSRGNGDYDVTMQDGTILRMSRTYVSNFKKTLHSTTQVD